MLPFYNIRAATTNGSAALALNEETLGSGCVHSLKKLFRHSGDIGLKVERILEASDNYVVASGTWSNWSHGPRGT